VELLYVGVVAKAVGPPPAYEIETAAGHGSEEVIPAVCGSS